MKIKKLEIFRPEIEVEYVRPIVGRIYLCLIYHRFIKIKKFKINCMIKSYHGGMAGMMKPVNFYVIAIPKLKVVHPK